MRKVLGVDEEEYLLEHDKEDEDPEEYYLYQDWDRPEECETCDEMDIPYCKKNCEYYKKMHEDD